MAVGASVIKQRSRLIRSGSPLNLGWGERISGSEQTCEHAFAQSPPCPRSAPGEIISLRGSPGLADFVAKVGYGGWMPVTRWTVDDRLWSAGPWRWLRHSNATR